MTTSSSFSVQSQLLRNLAAGMTEQEQSLSSALSSFDPVATNVGGAFGTLGSSNALEASYRDMTGRATTMLQTVAQQLGAASQALSTAASYYDSTDQTVQASFNTQT